MTEREMIDLIINHEEEGLNELLKHYKPFMSYIIAPILSNPEDQKECILDVVTKVWEHIQSFDQEKASFRTWLTAITRNTALNHLRNNSKHNQNDLLSEQAVSKEGNPEEIILKKEKQEALGKILLKLADKERSIFYRKYYYMQSTEQIAREMGMTVRSVEGKLYRIKQKLRKQMGGWENE